MGMKIIFLYFTMYFINSPLIDTFIHSLFPPKPKFYPYQDVADNPRDHIREYLTAYEQPTYRLEKKIYPGRFFNTVYYCKTLRRPTAKSTKLYGRREPTNPLFQMSNSSPGFRKVLLFQNEPTTVNALTTKCSEPFSFETQNKMTTELPQNTINQTDASCKFEGTWISPAAGVKLLSKVDKDRKMIIQMIPLEQPSKDALLDCDNWEIKGESPVDDFGPISLTAVNKKDKKLASFLGVCCYNNNTYSVIGSWTIGRAVKNFSEAFMTIHQVNDILEKEISLEGEGLKNGSSPSGSANLNQLISTPLGDPTLYTRLFQYELGLNHNKSRPFTFY